VHGRLPALQRRVADVRIVVLGADAFEAATLGCTLRIALAVPEELADHFIGNTQH
jgi:hypothetical protein